MNTLNNASLRTKLLGSFAFVALLLVAVAALAVINMKSVNGGMTTMYANRLVPISQLGQTDAAFYKIRGDLFKFIALPDERAAIEQEIGAQIAVVTENMSAFRTTALLNEESAALSGFDLAWTAYQGVVANVLAACRAGDDKEAIALMVDGGRHSQARAALAASFDTLSELNMMVADRTNKQGSVAFDRAALTIWVVSAIAVILAVIIGIVLTRSMARPLVALTTVAQQVAAGDLAISVPADRRADEIGQLAQAFRQMLENLRSVTMDVSEGKRLQEELRTASLYARTLIEVGLDPLVTLGPEGNITDVNAMMEKVTGVSRERLIGSDFAGYFTEPERGRAGYRQVFSQGIVRDYPLTIRNVSGQTTDVLYNASVYKNEAGEVQGVFAARDVTDSARLERQVQRQAWLKAGVAKLIEVMIGDQDLTTLASNVISELSTYLDAQIGAVYLAGNGDGTTFSLVGSYAYRKRKDLSNVFKMGEGLVGQAALEKQQILVRNVPEDYIKITSGLGERIPKFICVTPFIREGRVKGVVEVGTLTEMTEQQMEYLSQAMSALAVAVESAEARTNLAKSLTESRSLTEQLQTQQEELRTANEELEEQTQALKASEGELRAQQEELQATNEELEDKNELLDRQKSDVEKARRGIEEQARELAKASKYKSEFLANMSHELRTPLNSLLLLARSLSENRTGNLTEEEVESARIIHSSGNDLLNLINEVLDLSKIEAGRMDLHLGTVRIYDLADSVRDSFGHMAEEKGIGLEVAAREDAPAEITNDRKRIEQVIRNLMSNAIKFTDSGSVTVTFARPSPGTNLSTSGLSADECLTVAVKDTGIGIALEKQRIIFEAFQQADGGTAREYGGTGLGLSISRELARLLGGEIQVESELGKGSTFTLYLPVAASSARKGAPSETATVTVARVDQGAVRDAMGQGAAAMQIEDDRDNLKKGDRLILVIEDDPNFARVLRAKCHEKHFKCLAAPTGEAGLELADKHLPSAVLLDIRLPGMDGWAVLTALKEDTRTRHIPVHIVSAEETSTEAVRRGAIGQVTKPLAQEDLEEIFRRLDLASAGKPRRVLVVEDDAVTRRSTVQLIAGSDVQVDEAETGGQALVALRSGHYDCVVLDLGLPDMDGPEVLDRLEREHIELPPTIVYTCRELTRAEEGALREHVASIVLKDVRSQERLLDEVSLFLHRVVGDMPERQREIIRRLHNSDAALTDKKVLIVDDDMRTTFAMSRFLSERGMKTLKAENGERALRLLEEQPDVAFVLMDIMMPGMDGYEAIRRIRAQERFRGLPIIALTAKAMPEDREKCLAAGANDYLSKPLDQNRLVSLMRVWLSAYVRKAGTEECNGQRQDRAA
jgi:PAS domain S-box-containing protein